MKQEATRPEGPTGTKQEARKAEGLTGKNNGNLENMIERGFARALVKAADRRMPRLAALIVFVIFIAGTGARIATLSREIASNNAVAQQLQTRLAAVQRQISDADTFAAVMATAHERKAGMVPITALLEELTRLLPDSTWLSELRIEKETGFISGRSSNASELIRLLSRSSALKELSFTSPVVRDPLNGIERFQIRFEIRGPGSADDARSSQGGK